MESVHLGGAEFDPTSYIRYTFERQECKVWLSRIPLVIFWRHSDCIYLIEINSVNMKVRSKNKEYITHYSL